MKSDNVHDVGECSRSAGANSGRPLGGQPSTSSPPAPASLADLDADALAACYPPDPAAPIRWVQPAGFDPRIPGLGLPPLRQAEHRELLHALPSAAPLDEGGPGLYESTGHGTWNHDVQVGVFQDHVIALWNNHAVDEIGPGGRVLGCAGRILNPAGDIEWDLPEGLIELAPAPVPVRRRHACCNAADAVRGIRASGTFNVINERLFFFGRLKAVHGIITDPALGAWPSVGRGRLPAPEHFHFHLDRSPGAPPRGGAGRWDIGYTFVQEWTLQNGRLRPASPVYADNPAPTELTLTTSLTLPLAPLLPPFRDAPLLAAAPAELREQVRNGDRRTFERPLRYRPGTNLLAADGRPALAHATQFRRPDGSWVAVREYLRPAREPFYHAAEKPDDAAYYPPARRTNLYGAANPAAGELPDGRVFVVGNSPNRQTMFLTVSDDGRVFDRTWLLLHRLLPDPVPGAVKGNPAGPQYFAPVVVGESLWLVYSISKEHIGATRVPLSALDTNR